MIGTDYTTWSSVPDVRARFTRCSPNLDALRDTMRRRWQMKSLGCYGPRPIAGTSVPSNHSYGAAIDMGYEPEQRRQVETDVLAYLIAWSDEWHLGAIHDYRASRIWRAGRTRNESDACSLWWRAQKRAASGMGQSWANWLHLETTLDGWDDDRLEGERGIR